MNISAVTRSWAFSGSWASLLLSLAGCSSNTATAARPGSDAGPDVVSSPQGDGGAVGAGGAGGKPVVERDAGRAGSGGGGEITDASAGNQDGDATPEHDGSVATSHPLRFVWQRDYGQSYAAHVETDSMGAAIVSGTLFDTNNVVLGTNTLVSHGGADVMLSRIAASGAINWARTYGGTADDYPVSFVLRKDDGIDLVGLYNGTGNIGGPPFPPFAGTPTRFDVYVAGLAANGDHRFSKAITSTQEAFAGPGLALDDTNALLVPGSFLGTTTIASSEVSKGSWDAFFARYSEPAGAVTASVAFGSTGDDRASQAIFTGTDVVLLGHFQGTVVFPTTPPTTLVSAGGNDVFVVRMSTAGVMTSAVAFGGTGDEDVSRARLDSSGNVVVGGVFSSPTLSVLGGPALKSKGGRDGFVAVLSPSLAHTWSVSFGGDGDDYLRDLATGPSGTIAITGEYRDSIQLDKLYHAAKDGDAATTDIDFFVATLGSDGNVTWSATAGGPSADRGLGVAMDESGGVYVTASFQSAIDFGGDVLTPAAGQFGSALVRYAP
ncbi:MAG TPA: hypothetical protein VH062_25435 [Polyangiaceae bacterium]|jgi:hypothetical protein|nr:hypothetical protein [Polyangiaceae bacterium]